MRPMDVNVILEDHAWIERGRLPHLTPAGRHRLRRNCPMSPARSFVAGLLAVAVAATPAFAQAAKAAAPAAAKAAPSDARLEALKKEAAADVDCMAKLAQEMVDSVFSFGELGHQEFE